MSFSNEKSVTFWYRKPVNHYFSIENVFNGVAKQLWDTKQVQVIKQFVPYPSKSFAALKANCIYAQANTAPINHVTGDIYYITPFLKGKVIVTIHDFVLFRRTQNLIKKAIFKYIWYKRPIQAADIITVISPQIHQELITNFNVPEHKVRVIPNFVNPFFQKFFQPERSSNQVLFIGDTENKNLSRCIEALTELPIHLNLVGTFSNNTLQHLQTAQISYTVHTAISDQQLGLLYQQASIMLFPSLYEGFGLPIIEAQSTGLPVITSNINPMKWVAGEAALLVNPLSIQEIREAIQALLSNQSLRQTLVQRGIENIHRFSLAAVAQQYASCYE